jgi:hypothetical protein
MADRTSEPDGRLDREPPRRSVFGLGMRLWGAPDPRSAPGRVLCGRDGGFPVPHPYLLAHEFQKSGPNRDFQPARWTLVPALAGTMCRHAGKIGERRLPHSPFLLVLSTI